MKNSIAEGLIDFIDYSITPFHTVGRMISILEAAGFTKLDENSKWEKLRGSYFVTRDDSSLIAFRINGSPENSGFRIAAAHTDFPALKIKPRPEIIKQNYVQLGLEVYGGLLLNTVFDRNYSIAGRLSCLSLDSSLVKHTVDFKRPVAVIPSLAIHLDREANEKKSVNSQKDIPAIVALQNGEAAFSWKEIIMRALDPNVRSGVKDILEYDLSLYDTLRASTAGLDGELISGPGLDNTASCYVILDALINSSGFQCPVAVFTDHEEVGSVSYSGAAGNFLRSVLERISGGAESYYIAAASSFIISADNSHALHPNFPEKYDENNSPLINKGPVIKLNSSRRYASSSETSAYFKRLCMRESIPFQTYAARSDMQCGSTLGPLSESATGIRAVDVGLPSLAMHSIREICGKDDIYNLHKAVRAFFSGD